MLVKKDPGKRDIEFFGYICEDMGYLNNANLEAMKYDWCKKHNGEWWAAYHNDIIVAMAGCHKFHDGHRMLFRGVQTMPAQHGLGKNHMTSIGWKWILVHGGLKRLKNNAYRNNRINTIRTYFIV